MSLVLLADFFTYFKQKYLVLKHFFLVFWSSICSSEASQERYRGCKLVCRPPTNPNDIQSNTQCVIDSDLSKSMIRPTVFDNTRLMFAAPEGLFRNREKEKPDIFSHLYSSCSVEPQRSPYTTGLLEANILLQDLVLTIAELERRPPGPGLLRC